MKRLFETFLESPSGEAFVALREQVIMHPSYDFYSDDLERLTEACEQGHFEHVAGLLGEMMPNWLLSPRVHIFASMAAEHGKDEEAAERERYTAFACFRGLLESGSGTREAPFLVTHIADEYDLLQYLQKNLAHQSLVEEEGYFYDVLVCDDGTELWCDVSARLKEGRDSHN